MLPIPDPAIAFSNGSINMPQVDIAWLVANKMPMFDKPWLYSLSGKISAWVPYDYNAPASFFGLLCLGQFNNFVGETRCAPPGYGPGDFLVTPATAVWSTRQATFAYTGPLMQVERTSDSAPMDIKPDGFGNLDAGGFGAFCANTVCKLAIWYDQSGNGNNCVQATVASQPTVVLADALLGGRPSVQFTSGGATSCVVTAATKVNDTFANLGGTISIVFSKASTGATLGRLLYKSDGSTVGIDLRTVGTGTTTLELIQQASGSAGDWKTTTTMGSSLPAVIDIEYSNALSTNTPTMNIAGTASALTTNTAYTGSVSSDSGQNLIIGNNVATGGTNSFAGNIAEVVLYSPVAALSVVQLEGLRRNQAAYFNITNPVIH